MSVSLPNMVVCLNINNIQTAMENLQTSQLINQQSIKFLIVSQ